MCGLRCAADEVLNAILSQRRSKKPVCHGVSVQLVNVVSLVGGLHLIEHRVTPGH